MSTQSKLYVPAQMQVWFGLHWNLRKAQSKESTISYLHQTKKHPSLELPEAQRREYWYTLVGKTTYILPIVCTGCLCTVGKQQAGALIHQCDNAQCKGGSLHAEFPGEEIINCFLHSEFGWTRDMLRMAWLQWYADKQQNNSKEQHVS